jgi:hypothetical protein
MSNTLPLVKFEVSTKIVLIVLKEEKKLIGMLLLPYVLHPP